MKKIIVILTIIICICSFAHCETVATPTDIEESIPIEELYPNMHVELKIIQHVHRFGDEIIFGFDLVDYPPGEITHVEWQWSEDNMEWFAIEGENKETLSFIVTEDNYLLWYRVVITFQIFNI